MNKFFTILFIPEKTNHVKKLIIPAAYMRIAVLLGFIAFFFVGFMIYDYVNVMQQLSENRKLVTENRQLRQKIQTFHNKLTSVEESLERIQTFATKLRIITNQGDDDSEALKEKAGKDIPGVPMDDHSVTPGTNINFTYPKNPRKHRGNFTYNLQSTSLYEAILQEHVQLTYTSQSKVLSDDEVINNKPKAEPQEQSPLTDFAPLITLDTDSKKKAVSSLHRKRSIKISDLLQEEQDISIDATLEKEFDRLYIAFQEIQKLAKDVELDIQDLASTLLDQKDFIASMPTLKPTNGWYTSGFGMRSSPYTGLPSMHEGLDIANHFGQSIQSPAAGIVSFAGARPGYGKLITIDHGYGIQTQYGHLSKFYVKEGQRVKRGQKISAIGSTGRSTGPHVHYEVRVNGIPVDPYFYILND